MTHNLERLFEPSNVKTWLTRAIPNVIAQDKLDWKLMKNPLLLVCRLLGSNSRR